MAETVVKMRRMPKDLTITVTVIETPEYRLRLWLGNLLIRLAVWVWGCRVEFANSVEGDDVRI